MFENSTSHHTTLHPLLSEPSYFPTMARRGAHGRRHATIGDVHERDKKAHE